jgi:DNA-binding transcriptional MerR regulator
MIARGRSLVAKREVSTLDTRVRFPPPASSSDGRTMFSEVKTEERDLARVLRREEGLPINEIARRLSVSKSSVSHWVRDIELTHEQRQILRDRNPAYNRQLNGARSNAARHRAARLEAQETGRVRARELDPLHIAGCMLFWAEGSRNRNTVRFTNSDPEMVRLFVTFLRRCFGIPDAQIRLTCNLFADHVARQSQIEQYWLDVTELPGNSLCRSTVNTYSKHTKKKRQNKLPYGTCRVCVCRTSVVQSLYGSIQEYGGFTRPEWLE